MSERVRRSAGLLLHRCGPDGRLEVLLGHMGGPFWSRKEAGAWSIPKGEPEQSEDDQSAARREFGEELGLPVPAGTLLDLGTVRQSGGKSVRVFALSADLALDGFTPGLFSLEWPPRSGRQQEFPEIDRVEWCTLERASELLVVAQREFLTRLEAALPG